MKKFKKILSMLLAGTILVGMIGCGAKGEKPEENKKAVEKEEGKEEDGTKKACLITSTARGNEYVDLRQSRRNKYVQCVRKNMI
mgnify:CR=1 FL=1